jgi:hypothetical protein
VTVDGLDIADRIIHTDTADIGSPRNHTFPVRWGEFDTVGNDACSRHTRGVLMAVQREFPELRSLNEWIRHAGLQLQTYVYNTWVKQAAYVPLTQVGDSRLLLLTFLHSHPRTGTGPPVSPYSRYQYSASVPTTAFAIINIIINHPKVI